MADTVKYGCRCPTETCDFWWGVASKWQRKDTNPWVNNEEQTGVTMETVIPWQRRFSCHSGALQASISEDRFLSHSSWAVMESFWSSLWLTVLNHSDDSYLLSCSELSFFLCIFTITFIFLSVILLHLNVSHQECTQTAKTSRHDHIGNPFSAIPIQNVFRLVATTDLNIKCPE